MSSLEVRIRGAANLRRVADQIRTEGRKPLAREMANAISKAIEPVKLSIAREADEVMPSRGGYQSTFSRSLGFRQSRRTSGNSATVILLVYASGAKERRDINALNRGSLRHPVYGRSHKIKRGVRTGTIRPNPWTVTRIRPGFFDRGTDKAMGEAEKGLLQVIDDFVERIA